ncbi:pro-neuregulin-1, membrane-bound isoform isoform X1 [Scophthalmus maximus]|uniref:pro-neuregulin-1, membrane-bound isoform isoform X1 n=1 Tax=Scophthalmus maximus TaxID=52904 RepID=UPI001FA86880|nr:pro-neuregulin-1, membrane-bound isoform isoform X1 [Scophthalmus maximus]XP_047185544.1 pro-neuregulin-1, membrane-bound isoform isoform X1 [Scophthalmus maximus]
MTEGMEDLSTGPAPPPGSATPTTGSTDDTGQVPEEKPEETEAAGASGAEGAEGGGDDGDGEHLGAVGIVALPGTCCVCVEMEQINNCLHSEKICILPILACLLSLALCTAGLKWVFVDKIFEYEPPTHLEPKRIGQDPFIISVDPTLGITLSVSHPSPSTVSLTTAAAVTPGRPEVLVEELSTRGPNVPQSPGATQSDPAVTLKYNAERPTVPRQTPRPPSTQEVNDIDVPTISAASTTTTTKISSHVTRCSHSQRNYCVNGGECFTLEITPGSTKFLCRCLAGFTGHRCEQAVLKTVSDPKQAEELYQKRILTISGICIALLVVGIMCVVAYCKTKRRRKELHDRLRQSLRNKRNNNTNTGVGPNLATSARGRQISNLPLQDLQLINQCNGTTMKHAAEKEAETETTFSTSKYEPTTFTHISSQRFVNSPASPASPPSEMSAPLSSLAVSVPSVALSPSGEEERPLLLRQANTKSSGRDEQKRSSAHYNHGHVAHSLPSSPLFATDNATNYQVTGNHDDDDAAGAAGQTFSETIGHTNNNVPTEREGVTNGHLLRDVASSVSDVEEEEEFAPFLTTGHRLLLRAMHSSRTNSASCDDDVLVKSSTNKLHPVAAV